MNGNGGPLGKVKSLFSGILIGILLVIGGCILLWWNEGNNVRNIKTVGEARKVMIEVSSDKVDPANEGKLVATSGKVTIGDEYLIDDEFNVKVENTAKMNRVVEMFQYRESIETINEETVTNYEKVWLDFVNDSDNFEDSTKVNPKDMPYENNEFLASNVKVGAFRLSDDQVSVLSTEKRTDIAIDALIPEGYVLVDNYITNSADLNNPQIGDIRIYFTYNNDTELSILAMQKGDSFANYISGQDKSINIVQSGILSGEELILTLESLNNTLKWIFRVVGVLLCIVGCIAFLSPITKILSYVPLLGRIANGAINFVAGLVGFAISLVVIAVAWIRFRPLLGIALLAGVVGILFLAKKLAKSKNNDSAQPINVEPVIQPDPVSVASVTEPEITVEPAVEPEVSVEPTVQEETDSENKEQ